jgi:putative membrane protein
MKQLAAVAVTGGLVCFASHANGQSAAQSQQSSQPGGLHVQRRPEAAQERQGEASDADAQKAAPPRLRRLRAAQARPLRRMRSGAAGQMSDVDRQFINMAAKDGMKEVHMGQMAAQQGQSPEVKKLGQMIAADHTKANQQLMALAAKKGIKPDTRSKEHSMSKRDMKNFDQAWIGMMINDHQKDIAAYQRASQQAGDPEVRAFAKKTLPVLQKHLKAVQAAQKKMGSGGTNPAGMGNAGAETTKAGR